MSQTPSFTPRSNGGWEKRLPAWLQNDPAASSSPPTALSSFFGVVMSGQTAQIVRLTHKAGIASARLLPADELQPLMRDPLLRSAKLLSALFYENVVVCEGGIDRTFYQEINERLLLHSQGILDCLFLDGIGKATLG